MEKVLILLVMLAGVTHAIFSVAEPETTCNVTQNTSCSVTIGRSLYMQVITDASGHQVFFNKLNGTKKVTLFILKKEKVMLYEEFNRTQFFIKNGTIKISNVISSDSGFYSIEVFKPDGVRLRNPFVRLNVQEQTFFTLRVIVIIIVASVVCLLSLVLLIGCICRKKSGSGKQETNVWIE
ncbi:hypothetical protein EXN66_Car009539 [Channa argus]|uniref:Immunoglobulin subtype domain-containing protein n=1 Tax=Channa argus TaxID=215402 RepID=A0A6G1PUK4_CHAAH|nr:hypothetical protein EXN66_Car009539 [Channa argus]